MSVTIHQGVIYFAEVPKSNTNVNQLCAVQKAVSLLRNHQWGYLKHSSINREVHVPSVLSQEAPMHFANPKARGEEPTDPWAAPRFCSGVISWPLQSAPPATAPALYRAELAKFPLAHALQWRPDMLDSMAMPQSMARENCFSWLNSKPGKCSHHSSLPDISPCHMFLWKSQIWGVVEIIKNCVLLFWVVLHML